MDTGDVEQAWKLLVGVGRGWEVIGLRGELSEWLDELLDSDLPPGELGWWAKTTAGFLLCFTDAARAAELAAEANAIAPEADPTAPAMARLNLGHALSYCGRAEEATRHFEAAAEQFRWLDDPWHEASALQGLGSAAQDVETVIDHVERSARIFGRLHDDALGANCMTFMAGRALDIGEHIDDVRGWLDQAYELAARSGNTHERLHAELNDARLSQHRGDHAGAASAFAELLPSFRRIGDHRCVSRCLVGLGWAAVAAGDDPAARDHLVAGVSMADRVNDPRSIAAGLRFLAGTEVRAAQTVRAARLLGAADAAADRLDAARRNGLPGDDELREQLRQRIANGELQSALDEGYRTPPAELVAA